jgi:hypothetical protein
MIALPLLALTLTLAPTAETVRVETSVSGDVGHYDADLSGPRVTAPHATEDGGGASGNVRIFFRPVVDDDAAPPLQAYLQRASSLSLFGYGNGWTVDYGAGYRKVSIANGGGGPDLEGYFGPHRAIYGSVGLRADYSTTHVGGGRPDTSSLTLPTWISGGVRWRNLRVRAVWEIAPRRVGAGDFTVPFWGNVSLHVYGIVKRHLELDAQAYVLDGGASADGDATLWLARRFGIGAGINGGHETPSLTQRTQDFAGGNVNLAYWFNARFALFALYQPEWRRYVGNNAPTVVEIDHFVRFGFTGRL